MSDTHSGALKLGASHRFGRPKIVRLGRIKPTHDQKILVYAPAVVLDDAGAKSRRDAPNDTLIFLLLQIYIVPIYQTVLAERENETASFSVAAHALWDFMLQANKCPNTVAVRI